MVGHFKNGLNTLAQQITLLADRFLLRWKDTDRTITVTVLVSSEFLLYLLWTLMVIAFEPLHIYVNMEAMYSLIPIISVMIIGFLMLLAVIWHYKHRQLPINALQIMVVLTYMVYMFLMGYMIGYTSILSGVTIIGSSILALMLLNRVLVYAAMLFGVFLLFALFILASMGSIANAPIIAEGQELSMFWMLSYIYFAGFKIAVIFIMVDAVMRRLARDHEKVKYLSQHDALTGLLNRRSINDFILQTMIEQKSISLILLDLDFFKNINDTFGHNAGDKVLQDVAEILQGSVRQDDRVSRYGGEEYLIALPNTSQKTAYEIADRLCRNIENNGFQLSGGHELYLTASFGVAQYHDDPSNSMDDCLEEASKHFARLFELADKALYRSKTSGRNQVSCALDATS